MDLDKFSFFTANLKNCKPWFAKVLNDHWYIIEKVAPVKIVKKDQRHLGDWCTAELKDRVTVQFRNPTKPTKHSRKQVCKTR